MSLDELDAIYLGPDDELDSDSGSSSGRDVLNAIPDQSHPALTDDLPLFNDPDLYLGPEDDVIEFDDAPAVPDSPMTVSDSTPEPHLASLAVPEAPVTYRLGDYEQRHGNLPDPTVAQLLESHRPFRNTWAETCDKLRKADADLRRMQRVRQSTVEMLEVLETLIDYFEDEDPDTLLYTLPTQYLVHGARWPVLHAQDRTRDSGLGTRDSGFGIRDSGFGIRDSGFGTGTVLQNPEPRTSELGTWDLGVQDSIFSTVSNSELPTPNPKIQSSGL
ncbi:hypothetical protein BDR05DRAFT_953739 [Suillus weaverae]|nr:hypothetical protein BDR05DRAFT_953739 [Suillus weaverae]